MICKELERLELDYIAAREEARSGTDPFTTNMIRTLDAVKDHQREGHNGGRCPGD